MSSPIRNTRSSRSISSRRASWSAVRKSFSGTFQLPDLLLLPVAGVEEAEQLIDGGVGALVGEPDRLLDLRLGPVVGLLEVLLARDLPLPKLVLEAHHGVAPPPLRLLLLGAVLVGVDHRVPLEAVADGLDEAGLAVG